MTDAEHDALMDRRDRLADMTPAADLALDPTAPDRMATAEAEEDSE